MGKVSVLCLISGVFLVLGLGCAPVYQVKSGKYYMAMQMGPESKQLAPKTVEMTIENDQVTIKNPESKKVLRGRFEGNQFTAANREGGQSIEFKGRLTADNRIQGTAVQQKDGKSVFSAGFELTPVN